MDHLRLRSAVNANLQNRINTSLILNYVRKTGATYRSVISKALNLSLPAVSRSVDQLIKLKYLREKKIITDKGRQAFEVEINSQLGVSVGISIELPIFKIAKMDMAGKILTVEDVNFDLNADSIENHILAHIKSFLDNVQYINNVEVPVISFTIGVPAAIDLKNEKIYAVLYSRLKEINLKKLIENTFGVPVFLENNENLAIIAEKHYHTPIQEENFVFVTVHYGIGAGIFFNGLLYRGVNGAAGEIGYQRIPNGFSGSLEENTFEATCSIQQIPRIASNLIHAGKGDDIFRAANYSYENLTHTLIGELANDGNQSAQAILKQYGQLLATGIGNLLVTLNPELVVLGGSLLDLPNCEKFVLEPMRRCLEKAVPFPLPHFRLTRLGYEAAVIGACQMGLENTILQAFPYNIFK
ncbi:MAG: ROK family protein [Sphaerochaetaceae bacterium]